jgi:myo-inositol 2-dehydrogenase/D-chiro-inositol 1-dehydrogenase
MKKMQRRAFLRGAAVFSAVTLIKPWSAFGYRANAAVNLGIIGCGDRGTAVISSMSQHTNVNIMAMADIFDDQLQKKRSVYNGLNAAKGFPEISSTNMYQGSKAYMRLLENKDVDAVLISSPAYSHAEFLEASILAGKHVYCEKPVAPDVAGCKRVEAAGKKLNGKQSVVIGFQIRHATPYVEMVKRIHSGDIGDIVTAQLYYLSSGSAIKLYPNVSDDELRIRNHFHFNALSGGIVLDQGIHMLDVCNWALQSHPINAIGQGGIKGAPELGDTWNNYQILYQYPKDINVSFHSTQVGPAFGDVCARFIGTTGTAEAHYSGGVFINGEHKWDSGVLRNDSEPTPQQRAAGVFLSSLGDADANKEIAFIQSIETGNYLNQTAQGAESTYTAILGREASISREIMTWKQIVSSNQRLDPKLNLAQFDHK